jgi:hypothetical protein
MEKLDGFCLYDLLKVTAPRTMDSELYRKEARCLHIEEDGYHYLAVFFHQNIGNTDYSTDDDENEVENCWVADTDFKSINRR